MQHLLHLIAIHALWWGPPACFSYSPAQTHLIQMIRSLSRSAGARYRPVHLNHISRGSSTINIYSVFSIHYSKDWT